MEFEDDIASAPQPVDELSGYLALTLTARSLQISTGGNTAGTAQPLSGESQSRGAVPVVPEFDVLEWWSENEKEFPTMAKLARKLLAIPASSASSERAFSAAGNAVSQRRTALDPQTVNDVLFVHSNST